MADGAAPNDGGVRRRRSAHEHDSNEETTVTHDGVQVGQRAMSMDHPRPSDGHARSVRFSQDTWRSSRIKQRKSDEMLGDQASGVRELPLDTTVSQTSQESHTLWTGVSPISQSSPPLPRYELGSPKSRNRGHSLRSSLLMRNVSKRQSASIELHDMNQPSSSAAVSSSRDDKKDLGTSITVTPIDYQAETPPAPATILEARGNTKVSGDRPLDTAHNRLQSLLQKLTDSLEIARKILLGLQDIPASLNGRHIAVDPFRKKPLIDERTGKPFLSNFIKSSKYNAWNFFPRQLFAQFSKFANFYFLCISILQMIPGLSTTGNYTTIVPLAFFISVSMAKEGYEDLRRHRLDKSENYGSVDVLRTFASIAQNKSIEHAVALEDGPVWTEVKWQALKVGDVVRLRRDEAAPADLVLLGSQGANNVAFVETMALDGETNLKPKTPSPSLDNATESVETLANAHFEIVAEDPNLDLYNFEGTLAIHGKLWPITNNEIIYRGSILRNTPEALGLVVYSGEECKIRMNANKNPRIKAPALQTTVNRIVLAIAGLVLSLVSLCTERKARDRENATRSLHISSQTLINCIAYQFWKKHTEAKAWYIRIAPVSFGPLFTSFIIMFNTMIPLSLYVSMEIIKLAQMWLLNNDADMYDASSNTPFEARTSTINEELGQVGYVFTDKTGTLTKNVMRFKKFSIAGIAWLHDAHIDQVANLNTSPGKKEGKGKYNSIPTVSTYAAQFAVERPYTVQTKAVPRNSSSRRMASRGAEEQSTQELMEYLQRKPQTSLATRAKMMILSMAVCHTCLPERLEDDIAGDNIRYQASSPDELALVEAAKELGCVAYERIGSTLTIKLDDKESGSEPVYESYEVLDVIEFSSKRKRMSVVVRFPDGRICVVCKGADSVITPRLRLAQVAHQKLADIAKKTDQRRSMEAHEALRRKSSIMERPASLSSQPRTSNSLARHSVNLGRPSIGRLDPVRDEVEDWLSIREHDVGSSRTSAHFGGIRTSSVQATEDEFAVLDQTLPANESVIIERCLQHINEFATEGLRTLLYGHRFLAENEYQEWRKIYHDATTSLVDRQVLIEQAGELLEQQLELGGATAIEDKLQDGVPDTIERLRRANIKIWMLTGDKRETAINIGQSCRLIKDYSSITVLDSHAGDLEQSIAGSIIDINRGEVAHAVVIIDGHTLGILQSDPALHTLFLDLALLADSVICCRASPSQKASLVQAIRTRITGGVTLAIGDGANDIAMIQEAQVGIGITGKEGLQAARSSDYSIAQFRFLTKLLLVHGRWNYIRTCKYCLATFWKEMLFYLTQAFFQHYNDYSGTSLYESWSLSMFNTLFTSLTVIFLGIFEQDLRASTLIAVPELYTQGQRFEGFNLRVYLVWMLTAVANSAIISFTAVNLYGGALISVDNTLYPLGTICFTACILVITTKLQIIEQRYKSIMALVALIAMVGGWWLWNLILSALYAENLQYNVRGGLLTRWGDSGPWWLTLIVAISSCLLLEIGIRALKVRFWPTDVDTFQMLESDPAILKRFEDAASLWLQSHKDSNMTRDEAVDQQAKREEEVEKLLRQPRMMEEGTRLDEARLI